MSKKIKGVVIPSGYLPINRKFFEHPFWTENSVYDKARAWLDLLQSARWQDTPGDWIVGGMSVVKFYRGEVVISLRHLAKKWDWSKSKVDRYLDLCESLNMINRRTCCGQSIVKLVNYEMYNGQASNSTGDAFFKNDEKNGTSTGTKTGHPSGTPEDATTADFIVFMGHPSGTQTGQEPGQSWDKTRDNIEEVIQKNSKELNTGEGGDEPPPPPPPDPKKESYERFMTWINSEAPTVNRLEKPFTLEQYTKIAKDYNRDMITEVILAMENCKDLLKKYKSANLTFRNWAERRIKNPIGNGKAAPPASPSVANAILAARQAQNAQN